MIENSGSEGESQSGYGCTLKKNKEEKSWSIDNLGVQKGKKRQ